MADEPETPPPPAAPDTRGRVRKYLDIPKDAPVTAEALDARLSELNRSHASRGGFAGAELEEYRALSGARLAKKEGSAQYLKRIFQGSLQLIPRYADVADFLTADEYNAMLSGLIRQLADQQLDAFKHRS